MAEAGDGTDRSLKILHVLRAPLGGLFRHVVDLTREQIRRGHRVGLVTDATTGGETAATLLEALEPDLALGLSRVAMRRNPDPSDIKALAHVMGRIKASRPDVVHGHGSKGGVFARAPGFLSGSVPAVRAYTPHGGSLNHQVGSLTHRAYMLAERLLTFKTDVLLFESAFIAERYHRMVGSPGALSRVVHNGIGPDEFAPVVPRSDAADVIYVGELRAAKGIDLLLAALAEIGRRGGVVPRTVLVGSGPDKAALGDRVRALGLEGRVSFAGPLPARRAFALGHVLVVPSRMESLPYIALEAAAARVPLVATNVGGIPEIFGPQKALLVPGDDVPALTARILSVLSDTPEKRANEAAELAAFVRDRFSIVAMADKVLGAYREALARHSGPSPLTRRPGRPYGSVLSPSKILSTP